MAGNMKKKKNPAKKIEKTPRRLHGASIIFLLIGFIVVVCLLGLYICFHMQWANRVKVYTGTLPCADCSEIKETLTLRQPIFSHDEGTYTMSLLYEGRNNNQPIIVTGKWITKDKVLRLNPDQPQQTEYLLQVSDKKLEPLDKSMHPIISPFDMSLTAQ